MVNIELSDYFLNSVKLYTGDDVQLKFRIKEFIDWKETGIQPTIPFNVDKSSAKDSENRIYKPFQLNNFWHCHTRIKSNGDPLIAYRKIDNNTIRLVCITTHNDHFLKTRRDRFVRMYSDEFTKK